MIKKIEGLYFGIDYGSVEITERIVNEVADRLDEILPSKVERSCYDVPLRAAKGDIEFDNESLVVICVPVIKGRIPMPCIRLMQHMHSKGTLTIAVVNYTGAGYGQSLYELYSFMEGQGFKVISAGAFVSHIASKRTPRIIAVNRPDMRDFEYLRTFGSLTGGKLKRLMGTDVDCLKCKPAPLDITYRTGIAVTIVQAVKRKEPEWFL